MATAASRFKSVEDYLASLESPKQRTIRSIIDTILTQVPGLEVMVAWNVPNIHRKGKYVFGVCAFKHHLTCSPWSLRIMEDFTGRLGKLVVKKHCFQVPVDWVIEPELLKDLVRARLAELD